MAKLCSRCGFELPPTFRIKSKHTGAYYCADLVSCDRRARNDLTDEEITWLARKVELMARKEERALHVTQRRLAA